MFCIFLHNVWITWKILFHLLVFASHGKSIISEYESKPSLPSRSPWVMLPEAPGSHKHNIFIQANSILTYGSLDELELREAISRDINFSKPVLCGSDEWAESSCIKCYSDQQDIQVRRFYSLLTSKIYEFELPEANQRKCMGANYGWLLTIGFDLQINLLHPFTRQQISLPSMLKFERPYEYDEKFPPQAFVEIFIPKVALSKSPRNDKFVHNDDENCMVAVLYGEGNYLALARPGDKVWTGVVKIGPQNCYSDVCYYNDKFYAVNCNGNLFVCDIENGDIPKATVITTTLSRPRHVDSKYLVESSGELLVVCRICEDFVPLEAPDWARTRTTGFRVYSLKKCHNSDHKYPYEWIKVKSLGGKALFLGDNVSVSVDSSPCVKPNCIYFSEDDNYLFEPDGGGRDTGIFDMENKSIESHYAAKFCCPLSPPIWYI